MSTVSSAFNDRDVLLRALRDKDSQLAYLTHRIQALVINIKFYFKDHYSNIENFMSEHQEDTGNKKAKTNSMSFSNFLIDVWLDSALQAEKKKVDEVNAKLKSELDAINYNRVPLKS